MVVSSQVPILSELTWCPFCVLKSIKIFDNECIEVKRLKRKFDIFCRKMRSTDSEVRLQSHLYDNRETLKVK